jgi:O-acetyl-ADP-ribose deacetylase (regulator of RNase III)
MSDERSYHVGTSTVTLLRGDITIEDVDAIVNAANAVLLGGGGVDGAIHRAAGPRLVEACRVAKKALPGNLLATGAAVITPGFDLRARNVIHTVGPIWHRLEDKKEAARLLASCYVESLLLARAHSLSSISFPSISTGSYGYPVADAAGVVLDVLRRELTAHASPLVRLVFFDAASLAAHLGEAERLLR